MGKISLSACLIKILSKIIDGLYRIYFVACLIDCIFRELIP